MCWRGSSKTEKWKVRNILEARMREEKIDGEEGRGVFFEESGKYTVPMLLNKGPILESILLLVQILVFNMSSISIQKSLKSHSKTFHVCLEQSPAPEFWGCLLGTGTHSTILNALRIRVILRMRTTLRKGQRGQRKSAVALTHASHLAKKKVQQ
jgi:hypothetical protein